MPPRGIPQPSIRAGIAYNDPNKEGWTLSVSSFRKVGIMAYKPSVNKPPIYNTAN